MSDFQEPANLADMLRARAKTRGDAIAFEFEGRQTSFAELDINTNRVANGLGLRTEVGSTREATLALPV